MLHTVRPGASPKTAIYGGSRPHPAQTKPSDRLQEAARSPIPIGVSDSVDTILAERLRALRAKRKLTQRQVADGAGIPYESYAGYERAEERASLNRVDKLARFFRVSIDYLAGATQTRKRR